MMNMLIFERMGKEGLSHKQFPLKAALLLSPDILTSTAFDRTAEKESVPSWRDGVRGAELQKSMVHVAARRYFDYGFSKADNKNLFVNGAHWAAFARVAPRVEELFSTEFGNNSASWADVVLSKHREMWHGEHDLEIVQWASVTPGEVDAVQQQCMKRLKEGLRWLTRLFLALHEMQQAAPVLAPVIEATPSAAMAKTTEEVLKTGVVSSDIWDFKSMTLQEKKDLAQKFTQEAEVKRNQDLEKDLLHQAASMWRHRVMAFSCVADLKHYMETDGRHLTMRTGLIDVTMAKELQSGSRSRRISREPTEVWQTDRAQDVMMAPSTPVLSHILCRHALQDCMKLYKALDKSHPHKRALTVPVTVPEKYMRCPLPLPLLSGCLDIE